MSNRDGHGHDTFISNVNASCELAAPDILCAEFAQTSSQRPASRGYAPIRRLNPDLLPAHPRPAHANNP
eukprot:3123864-Rhodomonas_salina.4